MDEGSEKPDIHGDELSSEQGMDQMPPLPSLPTSAPSGSALTPCPSLENKGNLGR